MTPTSRFALPRAFCWIALLGIFAAAFAADAARAQTALSVTTDAVWRVDLRTYDAERITSIQNAPPAFFGCQLVAQSSAGRLLCADVLSLWAIENGTVNELAPLPNTSIFNPGGLAFDSRDRLWYVSWNDAELWRLDPADGSVLDVRSLALPPETLTLALAGGRDRLFLLTRAPTDDRWTLETIDPDDGRSVDRFVLPETFPNLPLDAATDAVGNLWVSGSQLGAAPPNLAYWRLRPERREAIETWSTLSLGGESFAPLTDVAFGTSVEIPTLSPLGLVLATLAIAGAAVVALRRRFDQLASTSTSARRNSP
ncbi:MAG: IPTL-CTERM sorting domain-containing protein [Acidobacteriota bacterium]